MPKCPYQVSRHPRIGFLNTPQTNPLPSVPTCPTWTTEAADPDSLVPFLFPSMVTFCTDLVSFNSGQVLTTKLRFLGSDLATHYKLPNDALGFSSPLISVSTARLQPLHLPISFYPITHSLSKPMPEACATIPLSWLPHHNSGVTGTIKGLKNTSSLNEEGRICIGVAGGEGYVSA